MVDSSVPVLSFPSILRNPSINSRFAHLHGSTPTKNGPNQHRIQLKNQLKEQLEGKRCLRRKDNAAFVGNPHIVAATKRDYAIPVPQAQSTFPPEPLPAYLLPRTVTLPAAEGAPMDAASADAGRFSVSLRGMRRDLRRRAGGRAERLVADVEKALVEWLLQGELAVILRPDDDDDGDDDNSIGRPIGNGGTIVEVSRTPLQLIWRMPHDAFARYVVHCCARYHEVVSFSKGTNEGRLTYLLRPNVTRPNRRTQALMETPPMTDIDHSSNNICDDDDDVDIDSDLVSEQELESSGSEGLDKASSLPAIAESPPSGDVYGLDDSDSDGVAGSLSGLESSVDVLERRMERISVDDSNSNDSAGVIISEGLNIRSPLRPHHHHVMQSGGVSRRGEWTSARSTSSPSRSPVRMRRSSSSRKRKRRKRRPGIAKRSAVGLQTAERSLYDYLFR